MAGSGSGEPVSIEVKDSVSPAISLKLRAIAVDARDADEAVARLQVQLVGLGDSSKSLVQLATAANQASLAQLKTAQAADKNAISAARVEKAQNDAAASSNRLAASELQLEASFNRAITAEASAAKATVDRSAVQLENIRVTEAQAAAQANFNRFLAEQGIVGSKGGLTGPSATASGSVFKQQAADQLAAARAAKALEAEQLSLQKAEAASVAPASNFINVLKSQTQTLGMTKAETLAFRAAQLGVTDEAAPFIAKIAEAETGLHGFSLASTQAKSELFVLGREAANGNWTRFAGSLTRFAQLSGLTTVALTGMGLAFIGGAVATGVFLLAAERGQAELTKLNGILLSTGNYVGMTDGQFLNLEHTLADATNGGISKSRSALETLASSGKISGAVIEQLGYSSIRLSELTGESADKIANDFLKMTSGVTNYAIEFNEKYHLLNAAQIDYIRQLERQGETERAEQALANDVYSGVKNIAVQNLGTIEQKWKDLKDTVSDVWEYMKSIGRQSTAEEELMSAKAELAKAKANPQEVSLLQIAGVSDDNGSIEAAQQKVHWAQLLVDANEQGAKWTAETVQQQQKGVEASQRLNDEWSKYDKNASSASDAIKRFRADLKGTLKANPNDARGLQDQANQAAIEARIKASFDPQGVKDAKEAESRALAIEKVNTQLKDQVDRLQMLAPQREAQQVLDRVEESFITRKITLTDQEKQHILDLAGAIEHQKQVSQEMDAVYNSINGPLTKYMDTIDAIIALQDKGKLSTEAANDNLTAAAIKYREASDAGYDLKLNLDLQRQSLDKLDDQKAIDDQLANLYLQTLKDGKPLRQEELTDIQRSLEANQRLILVHTAVQRLVATGIGQVRQLAIQYQALNQAYAKGYIGEQQYTAGLRNVGMQYEKLKIDMGQGGLSDILTHGLGTVIQDYQGLFSGLSKITDNFFSELADQSATTVGQIVTGQESIKQGAYQLAVAVGSDLVAAFVKLGIQWLVTQLIGDALAAAAVAASSAEAATLTAAWTPAAIAADIATLGGASVVGTAAFAASMAAGKISSVIPGMDSGGLVGGNDGIDKNLVRLSKGEFVSTRQATNDNLPLLQAMNRGLSFIPAFNNGGIVQSVSTNPPPRRMPSASARMQIEIHNYTGHAITAEQMSDSRVRIIAGQVADQKIQQKTGKVVASQLSKANSDVSSALTRHTNVRRTV